MAADFNKPVTTDAYTAVLQSLRDSINAVACLLNPNAAPVSGTANYPAGAIRFNSSTGVLEQYSGSAWAALATGYLRTDGSNSMSGNFSTTGNVQVGTANCLFYQSDGSGSIGVRSGANPNFRYFRFAYTGDFSVLNGGISAVGPIFGKSSSSSFVSMATPNSGDYTMQSPGGVARWQINKTNAEGGSNSGADLFISRFDDAGAYLGSPLQISRATGAVTIASAAVLAAGVTIGGGLSLLQHSAFPQGRVQPTSSSVSGGFGVSDYGAANTWALAVGIAAVNDGKFGIYDQTRGAPRLVIDTAGKVGIGTSAPSYALDVVGQIAATTSGSQASVVVTDTGTNGANIRLVGNGATTPNKTIRAWNGALNVINHAYSNVIWQLDDSGNMTAAGTISAPVVTQTSDETLKTNIRPLKTDAKAIFALEHAATLFDWRETMRPDAGFIAQRVGLAEPRAVHQREDGKLTINVVPIVAHLAAHAADVERRLQQLERRAA